MAGGTLDTLLERGVRAAGPDRTAVITDRGELSYGQLGTRAARLARHLTEVAGIGPGDLVAVRTLRTPDVLVAVLAVLRAGACFTVVAPDAPAPEALAEARAVISHRIHSGRLAPAPGRPLILLDGDAAAIDAHTPGEGPSGAAPDARAALLFTAGTTTGEPGPVPVPHARFAAAHTAWSEVFRLRPEDRVLLTAPPDTAAFTAGWIRVLGAGATLVLTAREPYTVADTDPVTALALMDRPGGPPDGLRLLAVGGERLRLDDHITLERRLPPGTGLISLYGPAEVAGCGTWFASNQLPGPVPDPERHIFLGRPFAGAGAEVRGGRIWLTPPDGGDAVPTGDLGRREDGGPLEFLGRAADRFRAQGRTIDPYRIEAELVTHPGVREALVDRDRDRTDGGRPIAYLVAEPGREAPDEAGVRAHLAAALHPAEIPGTVVRLTALPRTGAGRLDRTALVLPAARTAPVRAAGGKGGELTRDETLRVLGAFAMGLGLLLPIVLTEALWPGSTDLTGVPQPWAGLFVGLYVAEFLAFAAGAGFLVAGRALMPRRAASPGLTTATHLAIVYLLVAWWPQDNFYRLAAKNDWERQAALVYAFNIPLMIAAGVVAVWAMAAGRSEREKD
ncbi:AMP-binding protein [Streptomyces qinzhouensis]|nr:AMP-binding protein [Streptomyces qinzhouensis]